MGSKQFVLATMILGLAMPIGAQTIAEKKESLTRHECVVDGPMSSQLQEVNTLLQERRTELQDLYNQALVLHKKGAPPSRFEAILAEIAFLKREISEIQKLWRDEASQLTLGDSYALWHQPETSLGQLVIDYGAADCIYLISPEVGGMRVSLNSNLPIPREAWGECLELILAQYGIGIRELSPFMRELYVMRNDPSALKGIVNSPEQLDIYPPQAQVCYILNSTNADPRCDLNFLQKFSNPARTKLEIIRGQVYITATAETIQELLKLYGFANLDGGEQHFQLATLSKLDTKEMETILTAAFHDGAVSQEGSTLRVIALDNLSQSLFLSGTHEDVRKALKLIKDVEGQIENPQEKTVFWYTSKHSDPEELASVLARVYDLLINRPSVTINEAKKVAVEADKKKSKLAVSPSKVSSSTKKNEKISLTTADGQNNFIVDPKTGAIIMVVEQEALPKIKELLKRLDVPKKMVQLEVLLFEKRVSNQSNVGLNLLRLGQGAAEKGMQWGATWAAGPGTGIMEFLISRSKGSGIPAYDLAYQFLIGQEDVQINASPSVTTMNQTPAVIKLVEEISIDVGSDKKENKLYDRAQYGIIIEITPTINMDDRGDCEGFVTLDTDITFDTTKPSRHDRPDVVRRNIQNHVRIADGETLILGGLRRKNSNDKKDGIPFLGDIPGLGKLFSHTEMNDSSTEMFIFITPKIISDPIEDAQRIRREALQKRPGDIPEYLHELVCAQKREKRSLFQGSMTALFGRRENCENMISRRCQGEYDGQGQ